MWPPLRTLLAALTAHLDFRTWRATAVLTFDTYLPPRRPRRNASFGAHGKPGELHVGKYESHAEALVRKRNRAKGEVDDDKHENLADGRLSAPPPLLTRRSLYL